MSDELTELTADQRVRLQVLLGLGAHGALLTFAPGALPLNSNPRLGDVDSRGVQNNPPTAPQPPKAFFSPYPGLAAPRPTPGTRPDNIPTPKGVASRHPRRVED